MLCTLPSTLQAQVLFVLYSLGPMNGAASFASLVQMPNELGSSSPETEPSTALRTRTLKPDFLGPSLGSAID